MPKKIQLKHKPKKPIKKEKIYKEYIINDDSTIQDLIDNNIPLSAKFNITIETDYYNSYEAKVYLSYETEESDESFQYRINEYVNKKQEYDKWYEKNKEDIEYTKQQRTLNNISNEQLEIIRIEEQIKKLQDRISSKKNKIKNKTIK